MEIKVITISDSEESDVSENKRKPRSTLKPNFARSYDESVIYHQKPEFDSDRTFRKREQPVVIIESESEESDDSDNIYGNKKQKKFDVDDSEKVTGSEDELFLSDIIRKVIFLNLETIFSINFSI